MKSKDEKSLIRKALVAITKGNAAGLKENIQKVLFSKVRKKVNEKEKVMAKKILNDATTNKE